MNQLDRALVYFSRALESRDVGNLRAVHNSMVGLALTYQAMGRTEQAQQVAATARQVAIESSFPNLSLLSSALEARLALMRGDMESAAERAGMLPLEFMPNSFAHIEVPELTKLRF